MAVLSETYTVFDLKRDADSLDLRNRIMPVEATVKWANADPLRCNRDLCYSVLTIDSYGGVCRQCRADDLYRQSHGPFTLTDITD